MSRTQFGGGPQRLYCARSRYRAHTAVSALALSLFLLIQPLFAKYSGGEGTPETPYRISDHNDLYVLADDVNDYNKCFVMISDIDLDPNLPGRRSLTTALIAPDIDSTDGGFQGTPFTGTFDGNDFQLINLRIDTSGLDNDYLGLFGKIDTNAVISNLGAVNANIVGGAGSDYVAALVGYNYGTITDCFAAGDVNGAGDYVGGLVGYNYEGTITNCYATGAANGSTGVGGLAGYNYEGTITDCYAEGAVTGVFCVGGLLGYNGYGTVRNSYTTGDVSGGGSAVGGLVGRCYPFGVVIASFWDIESSGQSGSSGGKGLTTEQMKTMSIFQNAGWGEGNWVMQDGQDYPRLAWENTAGVPIPPAQPVPLAGTGTEADPYQVRTAQDFALLSWHVSLLDKHIVLMNDLDLTAVMLYPLGDLGPFIGVFEGDGHVVRNAVISFPASDFVGLFGYLGQAGQIRNLGVEDVNITGRSRVGGLVGIDIHGTITNSYATGVVNGGGGLIGGLVGYNDHGAITNCYAAGTVSGDDYVGGLVGENGHFSGFGAGTISGCSAAGAVSGDNYVGGLVGLSTGTITYCYATGDINGGGNVGGLVGYNSFRTITNCYAAGDVTGGSAVGGLVGSDRGSLTNCYATGAVRGDGDYVGGLVGTTSGTSNVMSCYATGAVEGDYDVGGLAGSNYGGTITDCYATGAVSGSHYVGGLVGNNNRGRVIHCYSTGKPTGTAAVGGLAGGKNTSGDYEDTGNFWDTQTSETLISAMGTGKLTSEMKTLSTFTDAGWDFNDVWAICEGTNYPKLLWSIPWADILCPDGVTFVDYSYLAEHYLWTDYGDVNGVEMTGDGKISADDFAALANWWGEMSCGDCGGADFTGEGNVDIDDLAMLCGYWLSTDYGDCEGAELTGDGLVDIDDLKAFSEQWLEGI